MEQLLERVFRFLDAVAPGSWTTSCFFFLIICLKEFPEHFKGFRVDTIVDLYTLTLHSRGSKVVDAKLFDTIYSKTKQSALSYLQSKLNIVIQSGHIGGATSIFDVLPHDGLYIFLPHNLTAKILQ